MGASGRLLGPLSSGITVPHEGLVQATFGTRHTPAWHADVLENLKQVIHLSSETGDLFDQAFQFGQKQVRKLVEKHPLLYPLHTTNGRWGQGTPASTHWSDGFLPGMMWIFHKHADQESVGVEILARPSRALHQAAGDP